MKRIPDTAASVSGGNPWKISAESPVVIETVAEDESVRNEKTAVVRAESIAPSAGLVQQNTGPEGGGGE